MAVYPFVQLDVFADRPGAGNPLAVVLQADGLDESQMQAIARWTRLPETTFILTPTDAGADYRVRIFSPRREVPFAGHPSIGSAHAVLDAGLAKPSAGRLRQQCAVGVLPLAVDGEGHERRIAVRAPRAHVMTVAQREDPRLQAALAGLPLGALPPVLMEGGRRWWLVELAEEAVLRSHTPHWTDISVLAQASDSMGLCLFARTPGRDYDIAVRALVGQPAQFEDAASGAANATLAAWLRECNALPHADGRYRVSQGREVGHDARLELRVDAAGEVWSGGLIQTVVRGQLHW